jgi:hypothetical protein
VDCRKQLSEARSAAAEAGAALAAERAARLAAEDREASRQGLMERLSRLQVGPVGGGRRVDALLQGPAQRVSRRCQQQQSCVCCALVELRQLHHGCGLRRRHCITKQVSHKWHVAVSVHVAVAVLLWH